MSLRQSLKTRTDAVELIDFAQDRFENHGHAALLLQNLKVGELQMNWLRSEDLKEEKGNRLAGTIPRQKVRAYSQSQKRAELRPLARKF